MPNCFFCKEKVGEDCYCYGCGKYICDGCCEIELDEWEDHDAEDHKYKIDSEFAVVND